MFKNYLKVAYRYFIRYKEYTAINILGLAVSIASCILVMLFVRSEWSYDRFHTKADRLYRAWIDEIYEGSRFTNTVTPIPLGPLLHSNIPEVETFCRVNPVNRLVKFENNSFGERITLVDSNFFQVFDFRLLQGNASNPFPTNNSLIITSAVAKRYFGKSPALGKNLELQLSEDKVVFTVTGVTENVREESSIGFDFLIPFFNGKYLWSEDARTKAFSNVQGETYILLKNADAAQAVGNKLPAMVNRTLTQYKPGEYNIYLQPISDIHLNNKLPAGNEPISNPTYSYILGTIGFLILLIACINFVTLSIGRSTTRALEVGVRKVLGAERHQLLRQFWGEAVLITLLSLIIGIALSALFLQPFSRIANRELVMSFDGFTALFSFALVGIVGLIAGVYPAIILSGFAPIEVLNGRLKSGSNIGLLRKGLIVGQFIASIIMIIGTIVIGQQLDYLRNKNLGYDKEHIVIIPTNKRRVEGFPLAQRFREAIAKNPKVISSSTSVFSLSEPGWFDLGYTDDKKVFRQFRMNGVDEDFVKTMGLQIVSGRNFSADNPADAFNSMIVNEALVREYGWKYPIGQKLPGKYNHRVIGVVKDFHFESLHTVIKPLALVLRPDTMARMSSDINYGGPPQPRITVRLNPGDVQDHLAALRTAWKSIAGDQDFEYHFLDETLERQYRAEQRLATMVKVASGLSIFIACMGLFGLATLIVTRRTKEIGIRKVLGADVKRIVVLLSKDFVVMILIAALISFPIAWWGLNSWLQDFAYRIDINWWVFVIAGMVSLFVALLTVSFQAIKAAMANPVKSLRTE